MSAHRVTEIALGRAHAQRHRKSLQHLIHVAPGQMHADHALLTMSMFLSLMSGLFVKDSTARARVVTTALLVPTVVIVPLLATALQSQRGVQLVVFVLISGIAVWVRRYGARAGSSAG